MSVIALYLGDPCQVSEKKLTDLESGVLPEADAEH